MNTKSAPSHGKTEEEDISILEGLTPNAGEGNKDSGTLAGVFWDQMCGILNTK